MGKQASFKGKKQYDIYKSQGRFVKNKINKLERHVSKNPDDSLSKSHLARIKKHCQFTRKSQINSIWTTSKIRFSQLIKSVGFKGNLALIDPDKDYDKFRAGLGFSKSGKSNELTKELS